MKLSVGFIFKISFFSIFFLTSNVLYAPKFETTDQVLAFYEHKFSEISEKLFQMDLWSCQVARYLLFVLTIRISMAISGGGLRAAIIDTTKLVTGQKDAFISSDPNFFDGFNIYSGGSGSKHDKTEFVRLCLTVCLMSSQGQNQNRKTTLLDEELFDFFILVAGNLKHFQGPLINDFLDAELIRAAFDQLKMQEQGILKEDRRLEIKTRSTISISSSTDSADSVGHEEKTPISARGLHRRFSHFITVPSSESITQEK